MTRVIWVACSCWIATGCTPRMRGPDGLRRGNRNSLQSIPTTVSAQRDTGSSLVMGGPAVHAQQPGFGPRKVQWAETTAQEASNTAPAQPAGPDALMSLDRIAGVFAGSE